MEITHLPTTRTIKMVVTGIIGELCYDVGYYDVSLSATSDEYEFEGAAVIREDKLSVEPGDTVHAFVEIRQVYMYPEIRLEGRVLYIEG